ncbi:MAG: VanW family protein [Bacillota bacterium]|nr:VanW family protein [Bacillota bacterium]
MKKKVTIISAALIILILAVSIPMFLVNSKVKGWDNLIYPGVKINNVDLSGKSLNDAKSYINSNIISKLQDKKITVTASGKTYTLSYKDLNIKLNEDDTLLKALSYGKDEGIIKKYSLIKGKSSKNFQLTLNYDQDKVKELGNKINNEITKSPKEAEISYIGGEKFQITESQIGYEIDENVLINDIKSKINGNTDEIEVKIEAKVKETVPKKTKQDLEKINTLISTFSTNFATSSSGRATNLKVAAASINGTVLMPGETFSFNNTIGSTTPDKGYKLAPVIINNEHEMGYGGGVCQIATTLYNAILRANLKVTERHHHSLPSSYVKLGMDATVASPYLDFKFTNSYNSPVYIRGYAANRNIYFNIYSAGTEKKYTYTFTSESTTIPASYTIKKDNTLDEGKENIIKKASDGHKVKIYKNTIENNKIIKTELIYSDTYEPVNGTKVIGTKKVTLPPAVTPTTPAEPAVTPTTPAVPEAAVN